MREKLWQPSLLEKGGVACINGRNAAGHGGVFPADGASIMNKLLLPALLLTVTGLGGCAADKPSQIVDLDEYVFEQALEDCRQRSIDFNPYKGSRRSYFDMCMGDRGYEPATYKHIWLNL